MSLPESIPPAAMPARHPTVAEPPATAAAGSGPAGAPGGNGGLPRLGRLLAVPALAETLGVHESTVLRWIRQGRLVGVHVGRRVYVREVWLLGRFAAAEAARSAPEARTGLLTYGPGDRRPRRRHA